MAREIGGATVTTAEQDVVAYARHFKGALFLHMETGVAHAPVRRLSTATVPFIYCCDCAKSPISPYGYVCTLTAGPDIGCWLVGEGLKSTTEEVKRRSALQCALRQAAPDLLHVTWVRDVSPRVVCTRTRRTGRHTRDMTALATTKTPSKHRILSLQAADETIGQALCIPTVRRAAVVAADQILLANHGRWRLR